MIKIQKKSLELIMLQISKSSKNLGLANKIQNGCSSLNTCKYYYCVRKNPSGKNTRCWCPMYNLEINTVRGCFIFNKYIKSGKIQ